MKTQNVLGENSAILYKHATLTDISLEIHSSGERGDWLGVSVDNTTGMK